MEKKIRTVFMSGTETGCTIFEALLERPDTEIIMAVTNPDRRSGRGRKIKRAPVAACAEKAGIELFQTDELNSEAAGERISNACPDAAIVVDYGTILSSHILSLFPMGAYNLHYSVLPDLRGAEPVRWALIRGYSRTGITCIKMDDHIDTGLVFKTVRIDIPDDDDYGSLKIRLTDTAIEVMGELMGALAAGDISLQQQSMSADAVYAKKIDKDLRKVDWSAGARDIVNLIRGMSPSPACYTEYGSKRKRLKIYRAASGAESTGAPGTVHYAQKNALAVNAGDGYVELIQVQPEGGRKMNITEFLAGNKVRAGEIL